MKYKVTVRDKQFDVEINDLHTLPIVTLVDGEMIEVWPDNHHGILKGNQPLTSVKKDPETGSDALTNSGPKNGESGKSIKTIFAPIPGTIISIDVREGDEVTVGQVICVLEAMKMKNTIRSPRRGLITSLRVSLGQIVQHHDVLVEFSE